MEGQKGAITVHLLNISKIVNLAQRRLFILKSLDRKTNTIERKLYVFRRVELTCRRGTVLKELCGAVAQQIVDIEDKYSKYISTIVIDEESFIVRKGIQS